MPKLIRRRCPERPDSWHIHTDVEVGTIARRSGAPFDVDQWEWQCGFYPGMELGAHRDGTGEPFEFCRVDFEKAWLEILSTLSGANFKEWRDSRDWHERKYETWAAGELLPSQKPNTMLHCPCGNMFDSHDPASSYIHRQHIYVAQAADGIGRRTTDEIRH
jgi:hypothetical protein